MEEIIWWQSCREQEYLIVFSLLYFRCLQLYNNPIYRAYTIMGCIPLHSRNYPMLIILLGKVLLVLIETPITNQLVIATSRQAPFDRIYSVHDHGCPTSPRLRLLCVELHWQRRSQPRIWKLSILKAMPALFFWEAFLTVQRQSTTPFASSTVDFFWVEMEGRENESGRLNDGGNSSERVRVEDEVAWWKEFE